MNQGIWESPTIIFLWQMITKYVAAPFHSLPVGAGIKIKSEKMEREQESKNYQSSAKKRNAIIKRESESLQTRRFSEIGIKCLFTKD